MTNTDNTDKLPFFSLTTPFFFSFLVIAPPPITNETVFPDFNNGGIQRSIELAKQLQVVCTGRKIAGFIKAGDINGCTCNPKDGIHLTVEAHRVLGERVAEEITQLLYPQ